MKFHFASVCIFTFNNKQNEIIAYDRSCIHHTNAFKHKLNGMVHRAAFRIIFITIVGWQNECAGLASNWKWMRLSACVYARTVHVIAMKKKRVLKLRQKNGIINSKSTFNNSPKSLMTMARYSRGPNGTHTYTTHIHTQHISFSLSSSLLYIFNFNFK